MNNNTQVVSMLCGERGRRTEPEFCFAWFLQFSLRDIEGGTVALRSVHTAPAVTRQAEVVMVVIYWCLEVCVLYIWSLWFALFPVSGVTGNFTCTVKIINTVLSWRHPFLFLVQRSALQ
jgi:hypothetical protein